ncbi:MAG: NADH:flavin oxidoreductase [Armatimonadetes bacterium]|nr:NADH:flavin oxidoreductase [Armatimonadota bacterium]
MSVTTFSYPKLATLRDVAAFRAHCQGHNIALPCDDTLLDKTTSPLAHSIVIAGRSLSNRFAIQPMEGWDASPDGSPSDQTIRRWQRFGLSGAKLIWGGEAVAVCPEGRANPNQLMLNAHTKPGIAHLRETLLKAHKQATGDSDTPFIGLQLTHSGRWCRPNRRDFTEPRITFHHPILDRRQNLAPDYPLLTDSELRALTEEYIRTALLAYEIGFDFVDIKHCHGYLLHELLAGHTRAGDYGGAFENRTRFLRETVQGIRSVAPGLTVGVRLSAFDFVPFRPDSEQGGRGVPDMAEGSLPYRYGFGVCEENPVEYDLTETFQLFDLLSELDIPLVNITAGSPYYNPHIQRPAYYPPSDGYLPPEDPLEGVARQLEVCRELKRRYPHITLVGSAFTYLQEFLPYVAQAAVREKWVDFVGLGRMVLSYPELPSDLLNTGTLQKKLLCRTFSDCTTAPRNGLISGCYPLDAYYKTRPEYATLLALKRTNRRK